VIRLASAVGGPAEGTGVKDCIGSTNHQLGLSRGHLHGLQCSRYMEQSLILISTASSQSQNRSRHLRALQKLRSKVGPFSFSFSKSRSMGGTLQAAKSAKGALVACSKLLLPHEYPNLEIRLAT
jgi:hypothetical protein